MITKGGINLQVVMNTYTPMYVKQIINKDLMDSTGNSSQQSLKTYMGKKFK